MNWIIAAILLVTFLFLLEVEGAQIRNISCVYDVSYPSDCNIKEFKSGIPGEVNITNVQATNAKIIFLSSEFLYAPRGIFKEQTRNVTVLEMNGVELEFLEENSFRDAVKLQVFSATHNKITKIEEKTFAGLVQLIELKLSNNKIEKVKKGAFKDLVKLERLWLDSNLLKTLDKTELNQHLSLKFITLSTNKITQLDKNFFTPEKFPKLEQVDLSKNPCGGKLFIILNKNFKELQTAMSEKKCAGSGSAPMKFGSVFMSWMTVFITFIAIYN